MTYDWFKSEFKASDLDKKSVDFYVPMENGEIMCGHGKFAAVQDERGYIRVAIDFVWMTREAAEGRRIFVPVEDAHKIVRNPPGSPCEFKLHCEA